MAGIQTNKVTVDETAAALNTAGPTSIVVYTEGSGVLLGTQAAPKFFLPGGRTETFPLAATDVLYAKSFDGNDQVVYFYCTS